MFSCKWITEALHSFYCLGKKMGEGLGIDSDMKGQTIKLVYMDAEGNSKPLLSILYLENPGNRHRKSVLT